jgi:hypothetical protein
MLIPTMRKSFFLLMALLLGSLPLLAQQGQGEGTNATGKEFPTESSWPDKVHLLKSAQVKGISGTGGGVSLTMPAGAEVLGFLSQDHMTVTIQMKDSALKGSVPVEDTDFLALALKNNAKTQESLLAEQNRLREQEKSLKEEAYWQGVVADMKKKDILVKSWSWGESSSAFYKAVGEIQNESGRELKSIEVEFITYDSSGNIINIGTALVHDHNLAPNETTTFDVLVKKRGGEAKAYLDFRNIGIRGERYSFRIEGK